MIPHARPVDDPAPRSLRAIVLFPEEATYGLTDEQYVRNVVDSVYRAGRN